MYCKHTQQQRDTLIDVLIDTLDVETFVSLWNNDDDILISFLLGGLPTDCTKVLNDAIWAECMITVSKTVQKWKHFLVDCI